jgi:hypothetical protein
MEAHSNRAVTVLPFEVFQRLTSPWGTPKTTEVVEDRTFCGSDCGSGFSAFLRFPVGGRAALLAAVEQGVTCPESGLSVHVDDRAVKRAQWNYWTLGHFEDSSLRLSRKPTPGVLWPDGNS